VVCGAPDRRKAGRRVGPSLFDFHLNVDLPPSTIDLIALRRVTSFRLLYYADLERLLHWMLMVITTGSLGAPRRTHLPTFDQALRHLMIVP
jgi:hypothetical protein